MKQKDANPAASDDDKSLNDEAAEAVETDEDTENESIAGEEDPGSALEDWVREEQKHKDGAARKK